MTDTYPLTALRTLADDEARTRVLELGARTADEAAARGALDEASTQRREHAAETARVREAEHARGTRAQSAGELARFGAWLGARRGEDAALAANEVRLTATLNGARVAADSARAAVALAKAEVEALERHRAAWDAERKTTRERRAEAEADDLVQARAHGRRGG